MGAAQRLKVQPRQQLHHPARRAAGVLAGQAEHALGDVPVPRRGAVGPRSSTISISRPWISCAVPRQPWNGSLGKTRICPPARAISPAEAFGGLPVALAVQVEHRRIGGARKRVCEAQQRLGLPGPGRSADEQMPAQPRWREDHECAVDGQRRSPASRQARRLRSRRRLSPSIGQTPAPAVRLAPGRGRAASLRRGLALG